MQLQTTDGRHSIFCSDLPTRKSRFMLYVYLLFRSNCLGSNSLLFSVRQHDSGSECTPGESKSSDLKERGNYIMYARATSGDKLNNNKFSVCSIRNISQVLDKKRGQCFVGEGLSSCSQFYFEGTDLHKVFLSADCVNQPCL